jgi:hypothetical protein
VLGVGLATAAARDSEGPPERLARPRAAAMEDDPGGSAFELGESVLERLSAPAAPSSRDAPARATYLVNAFLSCQVARPSSTAA